MIDFTPEDIAEITEVTNKMNGLLKGKNKRIAIAAMALQVASQSDTPEELAASFSLMLFEATSFFKFRTETRQ